MKGFKAEEHQGLCEIVFAGYFRVQRILHDRQSDKVRCWPSRKGIQGGVKVCTLPISQVSEQWILSVLISHLEKLIVCYTLHTEVAVRVRVS